MPRDIENYAIDNEDCCRFGIMKVFMLSLMMLIGVSFVGNSNNHTLKMVSGSDCLKQYVQDMDALLDADFGFETANAIATLDFKNCLKKKI